MPSAPKLEAPQGQPLFDVQFRTISESLAGNGVVSNTDLEVTDGTNALEVDVASGTLYYVATEYTFGGASPAATLSGGDATYDRWDTIAFDTGTSSVVVHEGTPEQYPEPPDISGGEVLLAIVYVASGATDIGSSDILNWRAKFSNEAEEVHYDDSTGVYGISSVDAALDELQEAAQISAYPLNIATDTEATAYPLALADLASPFALPSISDMDAAGNDLTDSSGPGVIYDASAGVILQAVLGGPPGSLTSYPLPIGDLNSPFALPSISDMDAAGNDLTDSTAGETVWDTSAGWVPRTSQELDHTSRSEVASGTNTGTTTSGEEVLLIDTATNGDPYTVTLASADVVSGREIKVIDVGGGAASAGITVDTEGTETIDGDSSIVIEDNYGSVHINSNGTNWFVTGGTAAGAGVLELVEGAESGAVANGDQGILIVDELADGETVRIQKAILTTSTVEAVPTGVDLELVTFDNAGSFTSRTTLISGDGATVHDRVTGSPVGSYTNSSGGAQSVGVIVDNGSGASVNIVSKCAGDIV